MAKQHYFLGCLFVVVAATCWGVIGLLSAQLNRAGFSGIEVAGLRVTFAAFILLLASPLCFRQLRSLNWKQLPVLSLQSILGVLTMTMCYFLAVQHIGVALAVALLYTAPVWSLLLAHVVLKEHITPVGLLLTFVTVGGVALCLNSQAPLQGMGVLYGLAAGFSYACFGVLGKKAVAGNSPSVVLYSSVLISGLIITTLPSFHTAMHHVVTEPSLLIIGSAIGLAVVGTLIPFALYTQALQWMPATRAQVLTIFEPLTAVILAAVLLHEPLGWAQYVGIALILGSALVNACMSPQAAAATETADAHEGLAHSH